MIDMAEVVYPQRKRCKKCGHGLGLTAKDEVLFGLYCSWKCAGIPEPAQTPGFAPRECKSEREGQGWAFKRRYRCLSEVPSKLRDDPSVDVYTCQHCGHLHIGHSRIHQDEKSYVLMHSESLSQLLIKMRGSRTHKEIGLAVGVRPIRIKELETDSSMINTDVLFKLLAFYRIRLAVLLNSMTKPSKK